MQPERHLERRSVRILSVWKRKVCSSDVGFSSCHGSGSGTWGSGLPFLPPPNCFLLICTCCSECDIIPIKALWVVGSGPWRTRRRAAPPLTRAVRPGQMPLDFLHQQFETALELLKGSVHPAGEFCTSGGAPIDLGLNLAILPQKSPPLQLSDLPMQHLRRVGGFGSHHLQDLHGRVCALARVALWWPGEGGRDRG